MRRWALFVGVLASVLGSCGGKAAGAEGAGGLTATLGPAPSPEELARREAQQRLAETRRKLLGRWEASFLVDVVFIDDGTMLVDGPGPADLSCTYELAGPDRLVVQAGDERTESRLSFFENKVRITKLTGKGAGFEGGTLTRK